jgi:hypothetical protein
MTTQTRSGKRGITPEAKLPASRRRVKSPASLPNLIGCVLLMRDQKATQPRQICVESLSTIFLFSAQFSPSHIPPSAYAGERPFSSFVSGRVSVKTTRGKGMVSFVL